jgi:hypothetical protein
LTTPVVVTTHSPAEVHGSVDVDSPDPCIRIFIYVP